MSTNQELVQSESFGAIEIEDPFLNSVIRNEYCAVNLTREQVEQKLKEIFSNPEVRKKMSDFMSKVE